MKKEYYKEFAEFIKTSVASIGRAFVHDTAAGENVALDSVNSPAIVLRVLENSTVNLNSEIFTPYFDILFFAIEPMDIDFDGDAYAEVYDRSFSDAVCLLRMIKEKYEIVQDDINIDGCFDADDACFGGVSVSFKIKLKPQCLNE